MLGIVKCGSSFGILAYHPEEMCRILELVGAGAPGHGPIHLLARNSADIGFRWSSEDMGWIRLELPCQSVV